MKSIRASIFAGALACLFSATTIATADLIGDTIEVSVDRLDASSATIGPGVELYLHENLSFDFDGYTLTIRNLREPDYCFIGGEIVFSGFDATILDLNIVVNRGFSGSIVEKFEFTAHSIIFDFAPLSCPGDILVFEIQSSPGPPDEIVVPSLELGQATELRWASRPGVLYEVWYSPDTVFWVADDSLIAGTGSELSLLRVRHPWHQHYRVVGRKSLLGENLRSNGSQVTPSSTTVGAGPEFYLNSEESVSFDFDPASLTVRADPDAIGGGWSSLGQYVFTGFVAPILDVSVADNQGFGGSIVENFSFTKDSITFDFDPWTTAGTELVFTITTGARSVVSPLEIRSAIELHWKSQEGVRYQVQHSPDLRSWFEEGTPMDGTGGELSVLRPTDSERRAYRIALEPNIGLGSRLEPGTPIVASFETAVPGSTRGDGDGGANDNLPWRVSSGGAVSVEAGLPNPPEVPGRALFANDGRIYFTSQTIDIGAVANDRIVASIDFRTFEDSTGSDWEESDQVEAWIEGSTDGDDFSRLDPDVGTIIPLTTGDSSRVTHEPANPGSDELEKLQLPNGAYTTFTTEGRQPIPEEIRYIRIRVAAHNNSSSERFFMDNVVVRETLPGG